MTQDSPEPVPAAFNGNGTRTPAQQTAQSARMIAEMLADLPRAIAVMLGQLARAIPSQHVCAACLVARINWEARHARDLEAAVELARAAHGLPDGAVLPPGFDPSPFLPERLRPGAPQGMPPLTGAVTAVGGTDTCSEHVPGRSAGRTLLIANGALSPSAMTAFARG